jgi:hypothetical protein
MFGPFAVVITLRFQNIHPNNICPRNAFGVFPVPCRNPLRAFVFVLSCLGDPALEVDKIAASGYHSQPE